MLLEYLRHATLSHGISFIMPRIAMRSKHRQLISLVLLIGPMIVAGCGNEAKSSGSLSRDPWGNVEVGAASTINIGLAASESDPLLGLEGREQRRGVELAISDFGQINGFPIELVRTDTPCSSAGGATIASTLIPNQSIVAVIGPSCANACVESTPLFDASHVIAISGACGVEELTQPLSHRDSFVRTMYADSAEGALAATYAYRELGKRRAVILSYSSGDTREFVEAFRARMVMLGGEVVGESSIEPGQLDFQGTTRILASNRPDVIYAPLLPADAAAFVRLKRNSGFDDTTFIGNRYYWSTWFVDQIGGAAKNVFATGPYLTEIQFANLTEKYAQAYDEQPSSAAFAYTYDAAIILLQALNRASKTGPDGTLNIGRKALYDALGQTTGFQGASGSLTCTNWGDCSFTSIAIGHLENGSWNLVFVP